MKLLKISVLAGALALTPFVAFAAPGIPHQFYGTAKYTNGSDIASGDVIVKIGTTQVASAPISSGKYGYTSSLLVTDANSDRSGATLKFFIGAVDTGTITVFVNGGTNGLPTKLDLTIAVPSDTVSGNGTNVSLGSVIAGEADMPTGATNVILTDTTVMDLSSGLVSGKVILQSGINGQPIVLTNSNLSNVSASIPDGTEIQGPAGWDGKITPPISGTPSGGNAPSGYSVGSTVISVGSPDGTLTFDKPVTILLSGVTGAVGYRPSGSNTWVRITNVCGNPYATPGNPPANGECAISNGTDTKIVTYHFTSFGSLTLVSGGGENNGGNTGGGGGGTTNTTTSALTTPTATTLSAEQKVYDTNNDNKIDVLDFNALIVHWGETGSAVVADFDGNGVVDVFDFNSLMVHWTA